MFESSLGRVGLAPASRPGFRGKGRTIALALGLLAVTSLLFSASALAAGKPKSLTLEAPTKGVNNVTLRAKANPNGAATKVTFEKWTPETSKWVEISSKEIGSGTTLVTTELSVTGLSGESYFRFTASNSFGPSTSAEVSAFSWWLIQGYTEPHQESVGSTGKFRMEYTASGHAVKVECYASGSGTINTPGGTKDSMSMNGSECLAYDNGKVACATPNLGFTMEKGYTVATFYYPYQLCAPKEDQLEAPISFSEPMNITVSAGSGGYVPVKMTAKGKYVGFSATFTIESNWFLNGSNVGKAFSLVTE